MTTFDRRSFLKALAYCLSYPTLGSGGCTLRPVLPELSETRKVGFEQFVTLSRLITQTQELDAAVSIEIYQIFMNERWGSVNLNRLYSRIRELQMNSVDDISLLDKNNFTESEHWFISHILMTWYTGIYFHSSGNRHITLKHALMYTKLAEYRQAKTYCGGEYGYWSKPAVDNP